MNASQNPSDRRTVPIRIEIATVMVVMVLGLGAVFGWLGHRGASNILQASSERLFENALDDVRSRLLITYGPVDGIVDLLSRSTVAAPDGVTEASRQLGLFKEALDNSPELSSFYVGYSNGDFFIMRPMRDEAIRERMEAPDAAAYTADIVRVDENADRTGYRLYLDAALATLGRLDQGNVGFDPRERPWYVLAMGSQSAVRTAPYRYAATGEVGVTLARRSADGASVVGADVTLGQLASTLAEHRVTPSAEIVLFDSKGLVLAYPDSQRAVFATVGDRPVMSHFDQLGSDVLSAAEGRLLSGAYAGTFEHGGRVWREAAQPITRADREDVFLALLVPEDELFAEADQLLRRSQLTAALLVLCLVPPAWIAAGYLARPLQRLASDARRIRRFELGARPPTRSTIREIDDLGEAMSAMEGSLQRFLELVHRLGREQDYDTLLERVVDETMTVCGAHAGAIYLLDDDARSLVPVATRQAGGEGAPEIALSAIGEGAAAEFDEALRSGEVIGFGRRAGAAAGEPLAPFLNALEVASVDFLAVPLSDRRDRPMGVLCLARREAGAISKEGERARIGFVRALSGFASVSVESQRLLEMEKALLESFIKLIAGAIDAKSPYTGGHCQRVPALTMMLAEAADGSDAEPFRSFRLRDEERQAVHIASWLHDCGKVTTPEHVVDKATKLEALYDRIHEVRTRFEVLKRDAEIDCWKRIAAGADRATALAALEREHAVLDEEFAFVAECNEGGEFMAPERVERLREIASRTWMRSLDDRIGISWEERRRKERTPAVPLPAEESLLADREEHLVRWERVPEIGASFTVEIPEHEFNRGEIHNLSIARGTLTAEERFRINDHIVQTILMLEKLPFPRHLRAVPEIAGGHHEKMDGTGYPRGLTREQMPLTARMMAIADIFEALTASDRPYKKAKPLSVALRIMAAMRDDAHIDPDLFELFLRAGIHERYAREFLDPGQVDEIDVAQYV